MQDQQRKAPVIISHRDIYLNQKIIRNTEVFFFNFICIKNDVSKHKNQDIPNRKKNRKI